MGDDTAAPPGRRRWGGLIAAKLVCCGALLLFLTGVVTVTGIRAWLSGGGAFWLLPAAGLAGAGFFLWRRRCGQPSPTGRRGRSSA